MATLLFPLLNPPHLSQQNKFIKISKPIVNCTTNSNNLSIKNQFIVKFTSKSDIFSIKNQFIVKCSSKSMQESEEPQDEFPTPSVVTTQENFPLEKRRKSEIIRDRKSRTGLVKPEPENFEVGWKRTKPIHLEKPKGWVIMDFLEKFEELLGREFGSTALLAKAGEIVAERAIEEAEVLRDEGKVEERMVTELGRVLKLMEMDLVMVKGAVKEETLKERIEQARARCRQAILVANSF